MKQLSWIDTISFNIPERKVATRIEWSVYIDGASRNNPGASGAGICVYKDKKAFLKKGFFLGNKTNNQAEYLALLLALCIIQEYAQSHDSITVSSDSQLLVRQINKEYKIKDDNLKILWAAAHALMEQMHVIFKHVIREENKAADKMANYGIDHKVSVPSKYKAILNNYGIFL